MAEEVKLLDLSFNTQGAVDGLDQLIAKSIELSDKKAQLTKQINAEKMAMAGARQNYRDNLIDQTAYEKALAKSTEKLAKFQLDLDKTNSELKATNSTVKATTTIMNSQAETVETLRAKVKRNTVELDRMSVAERTTGQYGKELAGKTNEMVQQLKELEKGIGDTRRNVGNYAEDIEKTTGELGGLTGATGMMIKGMSGGIASVKAFNAALMANPFVAIASAVLFLISSIGQLMNKNSELATSVKTLLAPIGRLIENILQGISILFTKVVDVFEWLAEKYVWLYNKLGLISDGVKEAIEASKQMVEQERAIYNAESENIVVLARRRRELEQLKNIISDQTKSEEERKNAAAQGLKILDEMAKREKAILVAKHDILEAERQASVIESDEHRRARLQALADIEAKEAEYASQRNELIGQHSGIEKAAADKAAAEAKTRSDNWAKQQAVAAEKARKAKEDADKKAAEKAKAIQTETLKSYEQGVIELQLRLRESNIGVINKEKAIEDQNELNQAILEKERYRLEQGLITQQEFDNIKYEQEVAIQEKIEEYRKSVREREKQAAAMDLENKRAIEDQNITDEYDLRALQLERQREQEIANAEKIGADTALINQKYNELKKKNDAARLNAQLSNAADTAGQMSDLLGQESEAGKIFAVAQATINTYLGASKAIAQGGIWGVAQAAIVIAAGLKQVASIMKVKDDVPKVKTSTKKFAKGGQIFGAPHSQGGVTFTGSNGQQFEAEGGENMYILNKRASRAINALSALNQQYGGRSFGMSNFYKFADGGQMNVIRDSSRMIKQSSEIKLSRESLAELALIVVEGFANAPNPIVSVQDITDVQQNRAIVIDSAGY